MAMASSLSAFLIVCIVIVLCDLPRGGYALAAASVNGARRQASFVGKVAVAGATGRTGRYVVQELLDRGIPVVALVRNETKAQEIFDSNNEPLLNIVSCDLSQRDQVQAALQGCGAAIWAASGVSAPTAQPVGFVEKIQQALGIKPTEPTVSSSSSSSSSAAVDLIGLPHICECLLAQSSSSSSKTTTTPQLLLLSSAGVTRLGWDPELQKQLPGCADIPIVRLNPGKILNIKAQCEDIVRQSGVRYSIIRPCGLNDKWPAGSRPVLSQGDVAVGRIHRKDVASVLVQALVSPQAVGKTFEVMSLVGYPPATTLDPTLARLHGDQEGPLIMSADLIKLNYHTFQQLLPGERQDAAALAMGQSYEQLDRGEVGEFGKRGQERVAATTTTRTSAQ